MVKLEGHIGGGVEFLDCGHNLAAYYDTGQEIIMRCVECDSTFQSPISYRKSKIFLALTRPKLAKEWGLESEIAREKLKQCRQEKREMIKRLEDEIRKCSCVQD